MQQKIFMKITFLHVGRLDFTLFSKNNGARQSSFILLDFSVYVAGGEPSQPKAPCAAFFVVLLNDKIG